MNLCEQKGILFGLAALTALGILAGLAVLLRLQVGGSSPGPSLQGTALVLLVLIFVPFIAMILLVNEFIRATREDTSWTARSRGLSGTEILAVTRHCPSWIKWGCGIVASASFIHLFLIGEVSAELAGEMGVRELKGLVTGSITFFSISLPVIASAAFMEGGYGD